MLILLLDHLDVSRSILVHTEFGLNTGGILNGSKLVCPLLVVNKLVMETLLSCLTRSLNKKGKSLQKGNVNLAEN